MNDDAMAIGVMVVVLGFVLLFVLGILALQVFFLLTLFKCMKKVSLENRAMEPGLVWLNLVPMLNLGWIFYTVIKIKESLKKEFATRNIAGDGDFGYTIGLTYAILGCCSAIPYIGVFPGIASLVFWIMYWVRISGFSKQLDVEADLEVVEDLDYDVKTID